MSDDPVVINGWTILTHPQYTHQLTQLTEQVEQLKANDPRNYQQKNPAKLLAAILKLSFEDIPQDPSLPQYRQGATLGDEHKHWFRAKFFQQYRLFFRYSSEARIIILAWANDESTKRAYGSNGDAYHVFKRMLSQGNPPTNWAELLEQARSNKQPTQLHEQEHD